MNQKNNDQSTTLSFVRRDSILLTTQWLTIIGLVVLCAYAMWMLNRGFDLTDEAFYLISAIYPENIHSFASATHWITSPLWKLSNGLFMFRAIGLWLLIVSATVLAWGILRISPRIGINIPDGYSGSLAVIATTVVGAMLYGSIINFTPSYNLLGTVGAYSAIGLALLSLSEPKFWQRYILMTLTGIALGLTVLCKFSTGFITVLLLLALLYGGRVRMNEDWRKDALLILAVMVACVAWVISLNATFYDAWHGFQIGLSSIQIAANNNISNTIHQTIAVPSWVSTFLDGSIVTSRLIYYVYSCIKLLIKVFVTFSVPLLLFVIALRRNNALPGMLGCAWFVWIMVSGNHLLGGMDRYAFQAIPISAAFIAVLMLTLPQWARSQTTVTIVFVLAILPFAISFGTGNSMAFQILFSLASWGALAAVLTFAESRYNFQMWALFFCMIFVLTVIFQTITSGLRAPYRLVRPLQEQAVSLEIHQLGGVKVDPETDKFAYDVIIAAKRCSIEVGSPFLGFYSVPGVALILAAVPLNVPWLFNAQYANMVLRDADVRLIRSAVIALTLNKDGSRPELPPQVSGFDSNYIFCGRATVPKSGLQIEIWHPLLENETMHVINNMGSTR